MTECWQLCRKKVLLLAPGNEHLTQLATEFASGTYYLLILTAAKYTAPAQ